MPQLNSTSERLQLLRIYAERLEDIMSTHRPDIDAAAKRLEQARAEAKQLKEMSASLS